MPAVDKKISENPTYTTPLDADFIPVVATATGITKKVSWANIKATLKTYFDTLYTTLTGAVTLTNKRITKRVYSTTSLSTLTPEPSTYDEYELTAQAAALTIANHSTSTPTSGDSILITITPDATPRTLTFGTAYVAKAGTALPTTTTASKTMVIGFKWNVGLGKWNLLAYGCEA